MQGITVTLHFQGEGMSISGGGIDLETVEGVARAQGIIRSADNWAAGKLVELRVKEELAKEEECTD